MGGHDHKIKVPDYRIYKVENVPELLKVQEQLAKIGLKDPWLRNEVWRYDPAFDTVGGRIKTSFLRGFKYGFGLFAISIALETVYKQMYPPSHGHDHH